MKEKIVCPEAPENRGAYEDGFPGREHNQIKRLAKYKIEKQNKDFSFR